MTLSRAAFSLATFASLLGIVAWIMLLDTGDPGWLVSAVLSPISSVGGYTLAFIARGD